MTLPGTSYELAAGATGSYDVWRWGNLATAPRAPVAQGIEHRPPEAVAQVRILPGAPAKAQVNGLGFCISGPTLAILTTL